MSDIEELQVPNDAGAPQIALPSTRRERKPPRYAISSPYLHKMQRRHFLLYDVLPFIGTIAAICLAFAVPPTKLDWTLFFVMWALTGVGLSVGFHRLFCHRSFKTTTPVRVFLLICGCMAARSSMITWASQHRRHHQLADHDGDVHSPNLHGTTFFGRLHGWWYSHVAWMLHHEYPNISYYGSDLLADGPVSRADRYYQTWIVVGLLAPGVVAAAITHDMFAALTGVLWGGVVRLFIVAQQISALNSLNHMFGTRPFKMSDNNSRNNALFGWFTWGEGWHNNHHAVPSSANFGFRWYQLDPGYWVILLLESMGLAWDVRRASVQKLDEVAQRYASDLPV
jgi:stearoyl-CoA desaturase (delta-9 desaturase)